jgi:CHASE3 domain sensor protein
LICPSNCVVVDVASVDAVVSVVDNDVSDAVVEYKGEILEALDDADIQALANEAVRRRVIMKRLDRVVRGVKVVIFVSLLMMWVMVVVSIKRTVEVNEIGVLCI